ncbi:MAG: RagB/SusD family nutrient uptake outer membrane protein, partial [Paludibacter sp.]
MKKIINNLISIAVLLLFATSCTDILNQKAVDTFNEDVVFSDINLVNAYLESCYVGMSGPASDLGLTSRDLFSSATDETLASFRPASMPHLKGTMSPDQLGIFENNNFGGYLRWSNLYSNIQNVNTILAKIDDVPTATTTADALKEQIKGEAYFIRAYDYTTLLQVYGGAILTEKPFELGADFLSVTRSSIEATKDFILKDVEQAESLIPETVDQGRATRGAAAALKSRLLLFCAGKLTNGGYEPNNPLVSFPAGQQNDLLKAARDAAKDIMDGKYGTYSLVGNTSDPVLPLTEDQIKAYADNYFYIFDQKGKWNDETIWGIQLPLTGGPYKFVGLNRALGTNAYHCAGNNPPTEETVRSFEMADGTPFVWDKYSQGDQYHRSATAEQLAADPNRNPYNGREPRFYASILYNGAKWQARGADYASVDPEGIIQTGHFYYNDGTIKAYGIDSRQALIESWNGTKTGYYTKKFQDPATIGQFENNTNTWVVFRYAEVLLNYAEA